MTEFSTRPSYACRGLLWKNYVDAWSTGRMSIFFKNSIIATSVSLVGIVFFSSCVSSPDQDALASPQGDDGPVHERHHGAGDHRPPAPVMIYRSWPPQHVLGPHRHLHRLRPVPVHYLITGYLTYLPDD
jgi:hypothetical protein